MSSAAMCGDRTGARLDRLFHVNVLVLADLTAGRYPPASAREARGPPVTGPVPKTPRRSSPGRSRFHLHRPPGDERTFFLQPGIRRAVLDRCPRPRQIFEVANIYVYATGLLALQRQYAAWSGLSLLDQSLVGLEHRAAPPSKKTSCLISTRQEFLARHHQCRKPPAVAPIELVAAAV